jgi:hypothetical protein
LSRGITVSQLQNPKRPSGQSGKEVSCVFSGSWEGG